ncbi:amino acid deaminase [Gymnodinialimonas sp. 57CJ19]|uniref:amino acid deaminase n=1 Tax=Gymnodinialimonas sp. 57CJ19 TaxID=3138498 RepID=UPI003134272B
MLVSGIEDTILDGRTKGVPGTAPPFRLGDIAAKGWNVMEEDMPLPLLLLKRSNLDYNAEVFGDYLTAHNLSLAPHGKTTMAPQIFDEQLHNGAWGITAATVQQALVMHHYGVKRILLGNQLIGKSAVASVSAMLHRDEELEFYCFVDSPAQLALIERHLQAAPPSRPIRVLLEVGIPGGRTGVRTRDQASALAEAISQADPALIRFAGVAAFEGVVPGIADSADPVAEYAQSVVDIASTLPGKLLGGLDEFILTGGGSAHFDMIARAFATLSLPVPVRIVLRSGCYVTNDSGAYFAAQEAARKDPARDWTSTLKPALEVWAYVQSRPEPGLALLTMGKRDAPYDAGLPVPFARFVPGKGTAPLGETQIFAMNDQHAFVRLPKDSDWQVGDMIGSGISHPCTAFDKWRFIPVVSDDYDVTGGILTEF